MRKVIFAICCAAAMALAPQSSHSQSEPLGAPRTFRERPPPATEPSVVVPEPPSAIKPKAAAPKPVARQRIVRRPGKGPTGPVTVPSPEVLAMMVRGALVAVNQANFTENYSVLHGLMTPAVQARVSAAQVGKAFADLRKQNLDLSPVLVLPPQYPQEPSVTPPGVLRLAGFFPTRPLQINFAIAYLPIDGLWLIDTLSISAAPAAAPGPMVNASPSPAQSQPARAP